MHNLDVIAYPNAFNCLNWEAALHNIRHLCPSFSTILINTYRSPTELFVDGSTILSQEGTTQGDPLAMPMYALGILPLIQRSSVDVNQVWYADDAAATGTVLNLKEWWDNINNFGPSYGYYANAKKTWLVVKEAHYTSALSAFHGTNLNITTIGKPHLGAPLGTQSFVTQYVKAIIDNWVNNVIALSHIATTQPHAAYSAFTHGLVHKWSYLARTVPDITRLFQPLEDVIRTKFIPCLTGRAPPNDLERNLLSLPPRLGGLGIPNPTITSDTEYTASRSVCKPLYNLILLYDSSYPTEAIEQQVKAKKEVHSFKLKHSQGSASNLRPQRSMDLAQEKGASNWLTTLPIDENGFTVHKGAFHDAIALRYGWLPSNIPSTCTCGKSFTVEHAHSCPLDGFPSIRHNEIRDLTANLMTEVCHNVSIEPHLQPITGETFPAMTANTEDGA